MFKAILFDLDGTLLDRDKSILSFIENQYERLIESLSHIGKEKYVSRFIELDNHGYVWKDKVYQELIKEFNITSLRWEQLLHDYLVEFKHHCISFPHTENMLDEFKRNNFALGIITNGYGQFQTDNLKALGIEGYFDVILVSEWEGIKKPNPQIFLNALKKLQIEPQESIFVGDHLENDIRAAENVGMMAILKNSTGNTDDRANIVIDDYLELPLIVKKLVKE